MKASKQNKLTLTVHTENDSAEVFIIDGRFKVVQRARGLQSTFSLKPGIYTVKVRAGFENREQHVALLDKAEEVKFSRINFLSPAPLIGTGRTHEYHIAAAEAESRNVHVKNGLGSSIFVFVRDWTSQQGYDSGHAPNRKPQRGLKLLDEQGGLVVDLEQESKFESTQDPWAACNVEVNPGLYRLGLELASGDTIEQILVASPGWQTQVFGLQRDYMEAGSELGESGSNRRADLGGASILLSQAGFNANDPTKRLVEAARLGLISTRQVLPDRQVNEILYGKFQNPMLGIFGAHLLLLNKQIKLDVLSTVVGNLRRMLGPAHPDVEALALRLGARGTFYVFEHPPMLRRSWWQVVDATIDRPELVPVDSDAAECANRIWGEEPWLQWLTPKGKKIPSMMTEGVVRLAFAPRVNETSVMAQMRDLSLLMEGKMVGDTSFEMPEEFTPGNATDVAHKCTIAATLNNHPLRPNETLAEYGVSTNEQILLIKTRIRTNSDFGLPHHGRSIDPNALKDLDPDWRIADLSNVILDESISSGTRSVTRAKGVVGSKRKTSGPPKGARTKSLIGSQAKTSTSGMRHSKSDLRRLVKSSGLPSANIQVLLDQQEVNRATVGDISAPQEIVARNQALPRGTETLLLVKDEEPVRRIIRQALERQGYDVITAANGEEALKIAADQHSEVHLLLTDVVMPLMSGLELAERLITMQPKLKVLYISGYAEEGITRRGLREDTLNFIQKPFDSASVARKVREVLDSQLRTE